MGAGGRCEGCEQSAAVGVGRCWAESSRERLEIPGHGVNGSSVDVEMEIDIE